MKNLLEKPHFCSQSHTSLISYKLTSTTLDFLSCSCHLKKKINSTKREVIRELNYTSHISAALKPLLNTPHTFLQPQDSPRETRTFHLLSLLSHRKLLDPPIDRPTFSHNLLSKIWHRENEKEREGGILCVNL